MFVITVETPYLSKILQLPYSRSPWGT